MAHDLEISLGKHTIRLVAPGGSYLDVRMNGVVCEIEAKNMAVLVKQPDGNNCLIPTKPAEFISMGVHVEASLDNMPAL